MTYVRDYPTKAAAKSAASKICNGLCATDGLLITKGPKEGRWYPLVRLRQDQLWLKLRVAERGAMVVLPKDGSDE